MEHWCITYIDTSGCSHGVLLENGLGRLQTPGRMMYLEPVRGAGMIVVIEAVALRQEILECSFRGRDHSSMRLVRCDQLRSTIEVPPALVLDGLAFRLHSHRCRVIRQ